MIYAKSIRYVFGWLCFALGTLFLLPTARGEPADDVSPFIRITNPVDNSIISNNIPYITIEFGDGGSGVDPGSLRILINDTDYTGVFEITETSASFQPLGPFSLGNLSISASISDKAGNTANADADFTVAASSLPIRYLFSVDKNPWIFASPGDGTYQEYLSAEDLGLLDSSDVVALSKMMPDGNIFFTLYDQKGLRQSAGDGSSRLHFDNDQLGLEQDNRILAGHIGQDGSFYLAIEGRPDIRQSSGTYTGSYFLQSVKLGIEDSARIKCLHLGDNDIIYFCHSGAHSIFQSTGDGTYSRFLTAADLGVAGSEIDAFAILSETGAPDTKEDAGGPVVSPSTYSLASVEAAINAAPTKGGIPLEVQFSAQVTGGTPPYTYAWDIDGDSSVDETRKQFSYIYQTAGLYAVTLTVTDSEAVPATDSVTIAAHVTPTVVASTNPVGGGAPLTVNLSAMVNDPDGAIVLYEWDFDGDGTYDYTDTDSAATTHTYPTNGLYRAVIRVTDNDNLSATDDVTVAVGELPTVTAGASATDGTAPLEVSFTGTATDSDGSIALYEWDFDGDGVFDWSSPTTGDTSYTYDRSGFFNAAFRATDNDGLTAGASIMISVSGPPIALPGAFPTEGDVPLTVTFFSDGKDPDGSLVEFAWDLDDNGSYEWKDMVAGSVTHTYHTAGVHNAVLKVTDSDGLIGTAPITINATDPNPQGYPLANAIAHPVNGGAPLDVALVGNADDANGSLVKYEWDFDGDGTYDWEEFEKAIATIGLLIDVNSYSTPEFVDIDNDGDIDLFIGETNGRIYFYRNDGNSKAPRWAAMGLVTDADATTIDVGNHSIPALTDIDNDGDLDLFIGRPWGC
jgi:PKD repeat protein